jgi:hypothetical protein
MAFGSWREERSGSERSPRLNRSDPEGMTFMQIRPNKSWWLLGIGVLLGAGVAYAADPRYDEASATITKATALLNAIVVPNEKPGAAFQRKHAIKALERAQLRIACAKEVNDTGKRGCAAALKDRFDDNDDDKDKDDEKPHKGKDKDKGK